MLRNAPDPIQGVMIRGKGKGREREGGRGTDHYTLDGVGGIPNTHTKFLVVSSSFHVE